MLSFLTPIKKRDWRTLGVYEAFIIALFTEMYGFPLIIYVLSSVFGLQLSLGHAQGHLLGVFLARAGLMSMENAWAFVMVTSSAVIFMGLFIMSKGWSQIHASSGELVTGGIYRYVRHPQYLGLMIITAGLLIQWPTIITIAMWPVLILMYYRLAKKEEKKLLRHLGNVMRNINSIPRCFYHRFLIYKLQACSVCYLNNPFNRCPCVIIHEFNVTFFPVKQHSD